jgi:hypothetical protein
MRDVINVAESELVDNDAVEIGNLYQKAHGSIVDSVGYYFKCGRRLSEKKAVLGHGQWLPWIHNNAGVLGFDNDRTARRLISCWQENRALASDLPTLTPPDAVQISRKLWGHDTTIATKHTGDPESYTPAEYVEAAREVMGGIDLDPASNALAQETVQAGNWFGEEENGLLRPWEGRVFLNPPYSYPEVEQFAEKLVIEYEAGVVEAAIMLTNNSADTKWWHAAGQAAGAVCQTRGRINFYKADGQITQPTNGQTIFYFGADADFFQHVFGSFGLIMETRRVLNPLKRLSEAHRRAAGHGGQKARGDSASP